MFLESIIEKYNKEILQKIICLFKLRKYSIRENILYYKEYQSAISGNLDFRYIEECGNAMDIMDMKIEEQNDRIIENSVKKKIIKQIYRAK